MTTGTEVAVRRPQSAAMPAKLQYAHELANSGLLPSAYRKNPGNVLWAVEFGEMLGLPPMAAITGVHVIEGKPTASAGLISALVRRAGHKLRISGDSKKATCQIVRADDPDFTFEVTWTLRKNGDDNPSAEEAGLLGKGVWKSYPASMLKSRAITQCARDACEEALFGLHYTAEELGAEVDEDGVVVGVVVDGQQAARSGGTPEDDPWYVRPAPDQAAIDEWVAKTLALVPDVGLEACRTLWRETVEKGRAGEVPKPEAEKVLAALKARMEALAKPAEDAAEAQPAEPETAPPVTAALDPDDPWMAAITDLADAGAAELLLGDARDQAERGELDPDRLTLIEQAVEELFPGITTTEGQAAA